MNYVHIIGKHGTSVGQQLIGPFFMLGRSIIMIYHHNLLLVSGSLVGIHLCPWRPAGGKVFLPCINPSDHLNPDIADAWLIKVPSLRSPCVPVEGYQ